MSSAASAAQSTQSAVAFAPDLAAIRAMANVLPGALPVGVNGIRVAASIRPRKFVIEGGDETPVTMPRTAFQIVYPDCAVMIDSGLDKATHNSFSPEKPEPYFPEAFAKLERALNAARLIVLTHYHADHVAGVVCAANFPVLARKTIVSAETADLMVSNPHRPHLRLTPEQAAQFIVHRLSRLLSGRARRRADQGAGPQSGPQMVYVRLQSGREILHSVDSAWIYDNILELETQGRAVGEGRCAGGHGASSLGSSICTTPSRT